MITRTLLSALTAMLFASRAFALEPIPDKLVVLTFDDSAKSHYTVARPILLKYKFGATFFITEGFDFLGYRVIRSIGTRGTMIPKVLVPAKAIKRFRAKVREMLAPSTTQESTSAKIYALNRLTRGWCEYYRSTSSPSWVFSQSDVCTSPVLRRR